MESSFHLISTLLNDLREAGILEYEFVSPQSASQVKLEKVEDAIQMFASRLKTTLEEKPLGGLSTPESEASNISGGASFGSFSLKFRR